MVKKSFLLLLLIQCAYIVSSQDVEGAWKWEGTNADGKEVQAVAIHMDGYHAVSHYTKNGNEFISASGGTYWMKGDTLYEFFEFDTQDTSMVGQTVNFRIIVEGDQVTIPSSGDVWHRIDNGKPGALAGTWLFSARIRDHTIRKRDTDQPRKTMKILSGTRFQWAAYNTATKEFMGTGGGTYTTENGKYTENIDFFSRDNSRVGAKLVFDYELKDGKWHHSGKSSKGDPMYEVWSRREK